MKLKLNKNKSYIVAEIGCNHRGSLETAKEMIHTAAKFCHADVVKFQKRCNPWGEELSVINAKSKRTYTLS